MVRVRLLDLNTWFSFFAGGPNRASRLAGLDGYLQKRTLDIAIFQELFTFQTLGMYENRESFDVARLALARDGLVHATNPLAIPSYFGQNSGLAVFSRFPLLREDYYRFDSRRRFSGKGVVSVDVDLGEQKVLRCVTLHLEHSQNDMKIAQLHEARDFLNSLPRRTHTVICGDFNICKRGHATTLYPILTRIMGECGMVKNLLENSEKPTHIPTSEQAFTFLDHIFVSDAVASSVASDVQIENVVSESGELVSDHCALTVDLEI